MAAKTKNRALGRGLSALLPTKEAQRREERQEDPPEGELGSPLSHVPITSVTPAPNQPRKALDEDLLEELTESIKEKGILSPILVREQHKGRYVIIAGERRWRAAGRAGLTTLPVLIKETDELEAFELALIENIQRSDLSPLEEANSFAHLMSSRGYNQEVVARRVGKERSTIANALRLLRLPEPVKQLLEAHEISTGHARALLGLPTESAILEMALLITERGLSVREVERMVKEGKGGAKKKRKRRPPNNNLRSLEDRLRLSLGTKVRLKERAAGKGSITIDYYTLDQLDTLIQRLITEETNETAHS